MLLFSLTFFLFLFERISSHELTTSTSQCDCSIELPKALTYLWEIQPIESKITEDGKQLIRVKFGSFCTCIATDSDFQVDRIKMDLKATFVKANLRKYENTGVLCLCVKDIIWNEAQSWSLSFIGMDNFGGVETMKATYTWGPNCECISKMENENTIDLRNHIDNIKRQQDNSRVQSLEMHDFMTEKTSCHCSQPIPKTLIHFWKFKDLQRRLIDENDSESPLVAYMQWGSYCTCKANQVDLNYHDIRRDIKGRYLDRAFVEYKSENINCQCTEDINWSEAPKWHMKRLGTDNFGKDISEVEMIAWGEYCECASINFQDTFPEAKQRLRELINLRDQSKTPPKNVEQGFNKMTKKTHCFCLENPPKTLFKYWKFKSLGFGNLDEDDEDDEQVVKLSWGKDCKCSAQKTHSSYCDIKMDIQDKFVKGKFKEYQNEGATCACFGNVDWNEAENWEINSLGKDVVLSAGSQTVERCSWGPYCECFSKDPYDPFNIFESYVNGILSKKDTVITSESVNEFITSSLKTTCVCTQAKQHRYLSIFYLFKQIESRILDDEDSTETAAQLQWGPRCTCSANCPGLSYEEVVVDLQQENSMKRLHEYQNDEVICECGIEVNWENAGAWQFSFERDKFGVDANDLEISFWGDDCECAAKDENINSEQLQRAILQIIERRGRIPFNFQSCMCQCDSNTANLDYMRNLIKSKNEVEVTDMVNNGQFKEVYTYGECSCNCLPGTHIRFND